MKQMKRVVHSVLVASAFVLPRSAVAQEWKEIGVTATGNPVYVDPASVAKRDSTMHGTFRVVYKTPAKTPKGNITAVTSKAMFLCKAKKVATKETIMWIDESAGTIYQRSAPKVPGFGPLFTSNFTQIAFDYVCKAPAPAPRSP